MSCRRLVYKSSNLTHIVFDPSVESNDFFLQSVQGVRTVSSTLANY